MNKQILIIHPVEQFFSSLAKAQVVVRLARIHGRVYVRLAIRVHIGKSKFSFSTLFKQYLKKKQSFCSHKIDHLAALLQRPRQQQDPQQRKLTLFVLPTLRLILAELVRI